MSLAWNANADRLLETASGLIPHRSFTGRETSLADWIAGQAEYWGARSVVHEVEPGRRQVDLHFPGKAPGRTMVFLGHLDIDPLASGYRRDPWTLHVEGDRIYGAGMFNMRAGLLSMLEAAQILRDRGGLAAGELVLRFVVGELEGGVGTKYLIDQGLLGDAVINPEPYGARNVITTSSGVATFEITTFGVAAHTRNSDSAPNAIEKMARVIPLLRGTPLTHTPNPDLPFMPRVNVGAIIGGRGDDYDMTGTAFVSDRCSVLVDVRYLADQSIESIQRDFESVLARIQEEDPEFTYEIRPDSSLGKGRPDVRHLPFDIPKDHELVRTVGQAISEVTCVEPDLVGAHNPKSCGGCDTGQFWAAGIPSVLYGPSGVEGAGDADDAASDEPDTYSTIGEITLAASVLARSAELFCDTTINLQLEEAIS